MKKLLFVIPFVLIGCVSPEQQSRNLAIMQGMANQQQAEQAAYQQSLENQQRQRILDLQEKQLRSQGQPQTYTIQDQWGNSKTVTVEPKQPGFGGFSSPYR
jgi:hypothetical protein